MYKCCFLACFCASQRVQRRIAKLTLAQIREKLPAGPIGTKFGTHVQIHMGMDIRQQIASRDTRGALGGFRGVNNSNVLGSCPIGTNLGSRLRIQLGMDIG